MCAHGEARDVAAFDSPVEEFADCGQGLDGGSWRSSVDDAINDDVDVSLGEVANGSSLPCSDELAFEYPLGLVPSPRVDLRVAIYEGIDDGREEVRLVPVPLDLLVDCRISAI